MANRYSDSQIGKIINKSIFFDANVLIHIFWPTPASWQQKRYSYIFSQLLKQKNQLYVDFLVISEIINKIIRMEYDKYIQQNGSDKSNSFKNFRYTEDGRDIITEVYNLVNKNIIQRFNVIGKNFDKSDLQNFLVVDDLDFNDKAIVKICEENGLVLLTDDRDYAKTNLDILTANNKLFAT